MKLYFDIGNTNIKINLTSNHKNEYFFLETNKSCTASSFYDKLPKVLKHLRMQAIFICSVVPLLTPVIEQVARQYYKVKPLIMNRFLTIGINLLVDQPSSVGEDLLMLAAYANQRSKNTIVVNLGTATTIIHVRNQALCGVIIMPGLILQLEALLKRAAKISGTTIAYQNFATGKNTQDALSIGIINSHIYAIERHLKAIDRDAKIIISGGNAKYVIKKLSYEYVQEATIQGMKVVERLNAK